jgi:hypothetical protein
MWDARAWHRWAQGRATCHKRCECVPQRQQRWVAAVPLPVVETRLVKGKHVLEYHCSILEHNFEGTYAWPHITASAA